MPGTLTQRLDQAHSRRMRVYLASMAEPRWNVDCPACPAPEWISWLTGYREHTVGIASDENTGGDLARKHLADVHGYYGPGLGLVA